MLENFKNIQAVFETPNETIEERVSPVHSDLLKCFSLPCLHRCGEPLTTGGLRTSKVLEFLLSSEVLIVRELRGAGMHET